MRESFHPKTEGPQDKWSKFRTNDELVDALAAFPKTMMTYGKPQSDEQRQRLVISLEKHFEEEGYPYPVSVSVSPSGDLSFHTRSVLDESIIHFR